MTVKTNCQADKLRSLLATPVDQLYGLHDIGTSRSWDYSLPTIGCHRSFTDRINFKSDETFFKLLKDVNNGLPYQILEHAGVFDEGSDVILFGGCLLDVVLNRLGSIKDFDLRLVGENFMENEAACVNKAKEFVSSVFTFLSQENERVDQRIANAKEEGRELSYDERQKCKLQDVVISRTRSTVSIFIPRFGNKTESIFQLTFAPARTVQEMLRACQPHCTRLAVKDGAVVMDHLALFSIESTAIVLDTSSMVNYYCGDADDEDEQAKRASSGRIIAGQFARFIKYHSEKGFDIVLPELDMDKVPRRNLEFDVAEVLPLPCMTVVYDEVDNNQIMTTQLILPKNLAGKTTNLGLIGDYDSIPTPLVGDAIHHNIRCLVNDVYDSFKFVAKGERWEHVFNFAPSLTPRMVKKSYETVSEDLRSSTIPIHRLTGYFSVMQPHEVVEKLISKPLREDICKRGALPKPFVLDEDVLKELVGIEVSELVDKIENLEDTLASKGLDKLVTSFPENVSTEEEVFDAIYGSYGIKKSAV